MPIPSCLLPGRIIAAAHPVNAVCGRAFPSLKAKVQVFADEVMKG
jgi:hypothetical protein